MHRHAFLFNSLLVCLLTAPASWGQTYNPTASDPVTDNTAGGTNALPNDRGYKNTGFGYSALASTTTGHDNTATGVAALLSNTTGFANTACGYKALINNTTGFYNTAVGNSALFGNTTGSNNTATGIHALGSVSTGSDNTATGVRALSSVSTGFNNIAVDTGAGENLRSGNSNIYLGNPGAAAESNTLRLGTAQTRAFIAGVAGRPVSNGRQVMITSTGQLGVLASSARYKQDIQPMGEQQQKLQQLRPVMFHYKGEPTSQLQYGLIAEEVAKVYPELVIRNEEGRIEGVRYEELTPLLLNEVQRQQQKIATLEARLDRIEAGSQTAKR